MLRQSLVCTADTGLVTFDWVEGYVGPYPDFNTRHRCRKYENIKGWMDEHNAHKTAVRMGDEVQLKVAP